MNPNPLSFDSLITSFDSLHPTRRSLTMAEMDENDNVHVFQQPKRTLLATSKEKIYMGIGIFM
jgi:hypothetical protein